MEQGTEELKFWSSLEYSICSELLSSTVKEERNLWCDGLIPYEYALQSDRPRIYGRAIILEGKENSLDRQKEWQFVLDLEKTFHGHNEIVWRTLLPDPGETNWLRLELKHKRLVINRSRVPFMTEFEVLANENRKAEETAVILYRPVGQKELDLVEQSGFRRWPPRLPEQPIFYPVTNEKYANEIAERWNTQDGQIGYVTRFQVKKELMDHYEVQKVGASYHTEWWVPAEDLEELNNNIIGTIEVIRKFTERQNSS